jgi:hypothetical protein
MTQPRNFQPRSRQHQIRHHNANRGRKIREHAKSRRTISRRNPGRGFDPPEDRHEPRGASEYRVVVRPPGPGYRHIVTPDQVRDRLAQLPPRFLKGLEVVQLSRMTRKKHRYPCYGLHWGCAIYLYPFDESLEEHFYRPPAPALVTESRMFGGRWDEPSPGHWRLRWTEATARYFVLYNVLIHELGHLNDNRNSNYTDQERFAEWFAVEYGYRQSGGWEQRKRQRVRRRHHSRS